MRSTVESPAVPQVETAGRATAFPGLAGLPWWAAVLLALGLTTAGAVVDRATGTVPFATSAFPGLFLQIGFYVGVVAAVLFVRRRALFTAAVQPPLVLIIVVVLVLRFGWSQSLTGSAVAVVSVFPTMAIGTTVVLVIAVVRLLAQAAPGHRRPRDPLTAGSGRLLGG